MTKKRLLSGRRAFLLGSGALFGMGAFTTLSRFRQFNNSAQVNHRRERSFAMAGDTPLRERAKAKGLIFGAATSYAKLSSDPEYAALMAQESNLIVGSSDFLWRTVQPKPESFNFTQGDKMVEFSRTRGMLLLGLHLVWHAHLPRWVERTVNRQNAEQVLRNHVKTVAGHYAGRMYAWSVVNEAIRPENKRPDRLSNTLWLRSLGPDYIEMAFRAAAKADPQALLLYNDNGLDHDVEHADKKRDAVLRLLERLKSTGTPVHALGMQAHLFRYNRENRFNPTKLRNFLSDVASLGLKILITELDVTDKSFPADIAVRDRMVAQAYEDYLSIVLDEPATIAVSTYGLSDRYTWLSKKRPRADDAQVRSLPFDAELKPKPAYDAIARAFDQAPVRNAQINLPSKQTALQDVQGHWAQAYVQALAAKNIISGYPDGTFLPNASVTRAEFAAIVTKAFPSVQQNNNAIAFQDVPRDFWGYNAIQTAVRSGFLAGYSSGVFQPNQPIPRAQVLVALASGLKLSSTNTSVLSFYQDASQIPTYATGKVAAATQRKLVVNYPIVRILNPNRAATRAEVAAFVYQALVSDGKAEPIASPYIAVPSS